MRISRYGLVLPTDLARPAPPQSPFRGFGAFGGEWEDWCDTNYWTEENNFKCKECPERIPVLGNCLSGAPWTILGKQRRGLPQQTDLQRLGPAGGSDPAPPPSNVPIPEVGDSWFEKNKTVLLVGGGVLAVGLAVFAMKGRGRRMNGLNGMRRRRKSRKARRN